jgi:hypothetical protein
MAQPVHPDGASLFQEKRYNVQSTNCCAIAGCATTELILEPEEAVLITKCIPCVNSTKRMPYGELGSVDKTESCGCCYSFSSNLSPAVGDAPGGIAPGCGCEGALVEEIVTELKARMKSRGDTGNIQRAEQQLTQIAACRNDVASLSAKVDAILTHLGIQAAPTTQVIPQASR